MKDKYKIMTLQFRGTLLYLCMFTLIQIQQQVDSQHMIITEHSTHSNECINVRCEHLSFIFSILSTFSTI